MKSYDVIVPLFEIRDDIEEFIDNWFKELPIRRLILGFGKDKIEIPKKYRNQIIILDQTENKTLGKCLAELMAKVETKWFIYIHSDVKIPQYTFNIIKPYMKEDVGGIEGEPVIIRHDKGQLKHIFPGRYFIKRGYSGFQVFRTKCLLDFVEKIEDDYVFTNEDIITQNTVTSSGFKYIKSLIIYLHYNEGLRKNTEKNAKDMFLGILKYTKPNGIVKNLIKVTMRAYHDIFKPIDSDEIIEFIKENNPEWLIHIEDFVNSF